MYAGMGETVVQVDGISYRVNPHKKEIADCHGNIVFSYEVDNACEQVFCREWLDDGEFSDFELNYWQFTSATLDDKVRMIVACTAYH